MGSGPCPAGLRCDRSRWEHTSCGREAPRKLHEAMSISEPTNPVRP